jgi:ubiquinone/menaquinone biosynthesis C-methylase UbiE
MQVMSKGLKTRAARNHADVAAFFDACAPSYKEQHGGAERLLRYRLDLLSDRAQFRVDDTVLEIGCGNGLHLIALAARYGRGIGTDLSPAMITAAREAMKGRPGEDKLSFEVDASEHLRSVAPSSVDVVLCVGSLEHTLDQKAALQNAFRVLKPGGRLVCLTLNGGSVWYAYMARLLGADTRQLATDRYLTGGELRRLARDAGFGEPVIDAWTFVQRGDMPAATARLLAILDGVGRLLRLSFLRGGLRLYAVREP